MTDTRFPDAAKQENVNVTSIDEESEKKRLLNELVIAQADRIAPGFAKKLKTPIREPNEDCSGVADATIDWADSPWGRGLAKVLYCQIYRSKGDTTENIAKMQRSMEVFLLAAESENWSPLHLFGKVTSKYYEYNVFDEGRGRGRVSAEDMIVELAPFCGENYVSRYSYMKAVCSLYEHCPEIESAMHNTLEERGDVPEEWRLLHEPVVLHPLDDASIEQVKNKLALGENTYQLPFLEAELKILAQSDTVDRGLVQDIVLLMQDICATVAVRVGFTAENAPQLYYLFTPEGSTAKDVLDGDTDDFFYNAGTTYIETEDPYLYGRIIVLRTAALVAHIARLIQKKITKEAFVREWTKAIGHEYHHVLGHYQHPAYGEFFTNIAILANAGKLNQDDDYDYIPGEVAAYRWEIEFNRQMALIERQLAILNGVQNRNVG